MYRNYLAVVREINKFQLKSSHCLIYFLGFLMLTVIFTGCGDVEPITPPPPPEVAEISDILKNRWKLGYETETLRMIKDLDG